MTRTVRAGVGAFLTTVLAAATLALAAPSGAQPAAITFSPSGAAMQVGSLVVVGTLATPCDTTPAASAVTFEFGGAPTTAVTATIVSASQFTLTVPSTLKTVPGASEDLTVTVTCPVATAPVQSTGVLEWAQIDITKTVTGDGPTGARYTIDGACLFDQADSMTSTTLSPAVLVPTTFSVQLAAGEKASLMFTDSAACAFTEPDPLGAATTIDPGEVVLDLPTLFLVDVTNTYPTATPKFTG